MSRVPLYMHKVAGWEVTNTGLTANKVDRLEGHRAELEEKMVLFKEMNAEHGALTTRKQDVAKKMQVLFREVETLVAFIRAGLRQHYGKDSEQLIQYGLQPFRGLKTSEEKAAKSKTSGASGEPTPAS
jgi:hypothetical protein